MKYNLQQLVTAREMLLLHDIDDIILDGVILREVTVWGEYDTDHAKLSRTLKWLTANGLALVKDRHDSFSVSIPLNGVYYLPVKDVVVHRAVQMLLTPALLHNSYTHAFRTRLENSRKVTIKPLIRKEALNRLLYALVNRESAMSTEMLVQDLNKSLNSYEFSIKDVIITGEHAMLTFTPSVWTQAAETAVSLCGLPTYTLTLTNGS